MRPICYTPSTGARAVGSAAAALRAAATHHGVQRVPDFRAGAQFGRIPADRRTGSVAGGDRHWLGGPPAASANVSVVSGPEFRTADALRALRGPRQRRCLASRNRRKPARQARIFASASRAWMGAAGYAALLQRPVLAVENAEPLAGPFPLIVIGQGFWIEPAISLAALAEYLAGRGFVVATAPLVGTNSPVVRVDEAGSGDSGSAICNSSLRVRVSCHSSARTSLESWASTWAGWRGYCSAMRNRDVDDSWGCRQGILFEHPSGLPRISPGYDPLALRVPWLQIMPGGASDPPPGSDRHRCFEAARYSDRYLLLTAEHGSRGSHDRWSDRGTRPPMAGSVHASDGHRQRGSKSFRPYVLNFLTAFLAPEAESRAAGLAFLSRAPEERPRLENDARASTGAAARRSLTRNSWRRSWPVEVTRRSEASCRGGRRAEPHAARRELAGRGSSRICCSRGGSARRPFPYRVHDREVPLVARRVRGCSRKRRSRRATTRGDRDYAASSSSSIRTIRTSNSARMVA